MSQRVLVAGAGGFIGGHLVKKFLSLGYEVRAVDRKPIDNWYQTFATAENLTLDLSEKQACYKACLGIDTVYNLAADMGGMGFIETHKAECMLSVLINTHLLMASRDMNVKRFFYASSACVYNATKQEGLDSVALKEEDAYPALPEDGYGWEKLFSERMCRHFKEDFGIDVRVARFHNVYGPYGTWDGGREKAPAAVCRKVIRSLFSGDHTITIWGDGNQQRSFMYIDDCVNGIIRIMDADINEPINLGSSELVSINQLVSLAETFADITLHRQYDLTAPKGVRSRNSDNTKILALLKWEPRTSLRDGLKATYDWIKEQINSGRADSDVTTILQTKVVEPRLPA